MPCVTPIPTNQHCRPMSPSLGVRLATRRSPLSIDAPPAATAATAFPVTSCPRSRRTPNRAPRLSKKGCVDSRSHRPRRIPPNGPCSGQPPYVLHNHDPPSRDSFRGTPACLSPALGNFPAAEGGRELAARFGAARREKGRCWGGKTAASSCAR